jgi:hypothetical protein
MKNNRRTLFEIVLIIIIIFEACILYYFKDQITILDEYRTNARLIESTCIQQYSRIEELEKNNDFDGLLDFTQNLELHGWDNDKFVLYALAKANYMKNNKKASIQLLESAISGEFYCRSYRLSNDKHKNIIEAIDRYNLGELYKEVANTEKAKIQKALSFKLAKESMGAEFDENKFLSLCLDNSFSNKNGKLGGILK